MDSRYYYLVKMQQLGFTAEEALLILQSLVLESFTHPGNVRIEDHAREVLAAVARQYCVIRSMETLDS